MAVAPGEALLYRTVDENGQLTSVLPVRLVEETPEQISLWLRTGTPSMKPVLHDHVPGTPRRWLPGTWSLEPATWRWADLLILLPTDRPHAVWVCWTPEGEFRGWYVNLQDRLRRTRLGFDHWDQQLDIVVDPDRSWRLKDEDELDVVVELGRMSPAQADGVRDEAQRVIAAIEAGEPPFTPEVSQWRPPEEWDIPDLPQDWAELV